MHQIINAQFLELQHHRSQIRPQDFWIRVVLCQVRGAREARGTIQNELVGGAYYLLVHHSCVNVNRDRGSGPFEGLFNLF